MRPFNETVEIYEKLFDVIHKRLTEIETDIEELKNLITSEENTKESKTEV